MIKIVALEACEPMELLRNDNSSKVWIRRKPQGDSYWPIIEIKGEDTDVHDFITLNWDRDTADAVVYNRGEFVD